MPGGPGGAGGRKSKGVDVRKGTDGGEVRTVGCGWSQGKPKVDLEGWKWVGLDAQSHQPSIFLYF